MSFDIYSHRAGGTDDSTLGPILAFVEPFVVRDPEIRPHDSIPRLQVPDGKGGFASAYIGDPSEWGEGDHLVITYNRPTGPLLPLLRVIHHIATLGEQTLAVPAGLSVVTTKLPGLTPLRRNETLLSFVVLRTFLPTGSVAVAYEARRP